MSGGSRGRPLAHGVSVGAVYGKWTVIGRVDDRWQVRCECGRLSRAHGSNLADGKTTSCGKCRPKHPRVRPSKARPKSEHKPRTGGTTIRDLVGQRFGRLVVERMAPGDGLGQGARWVCACDCGGTKTVRGKDLNYGNTASCGCGRARPKGTPRNGPRGPNVEGVDRPWARGQGAAA